MSGYTELIQNLKSCCFGCKLWDGFECCLNGDCTAHTRLKAADAIEELIADRKIGKWERTSKNLMACSACGNCVVDYRISGMFFCPSCGAKMDIPDVEEGKE